MAGSLGRLKPFFTIGADERANVLQALNYPLSGYLGGVHKAGYWVEKLQHDWANEMEVSHAIACNSATSGLLAACIACGVSAEDEVWVTSYSMSATAAVAVALGAKVRYLDIEPYTFGVDGLKLPEGGKPKAIIVTHLFGTPMRDIHLLEAVCWEQDIHLIEDCAQAPFAGVDGKPVGTFGDFGVFSLNVHKHVNCGEGGVIVTNDEHLATWARDAVNHGELRGGNGIGLNLRMTEVTAAIACAQLKKVQDIIGKKQDLAMTLTHALYASGINNKIRPPSMHGVFYVWAALCDHPSTADIFADGLAKAGLPARAGYAPLLPDVFRSEEKVPVARDVNSRIVCFDCCQIDPTEKQIKIIGDLVQEAARRAVG